MRRFVLSDFNPPEPAFLPITPWTGHDEEPDLLDPPDSWQLAETQDTFDTTTDPYALNYDHIPTIYVGDDASVPEAFYLNKSESIENINDEENWTALETMVRSTSTSIERVIQFIDFMLDVGYHEDDLFQVLINTGRFDILSIIDIAAPRQNGVILN